MGTWRRPSVGPAAPTATFLAVSVFVAGCGYLPFGPVVTVPMETPHRMTVEQVQAVVSSMLTNNAVKIRRQLRPVKVTRITLVPAGQRYDARWADGSSSGGSFVEDAPYWAIEAEGTFRTCASSCSVYGVGVVIIDDRTGQERGSAAREPTRPSP
jgi:hypothetical protein